MRRKKLEDSGYEIEYAFDVAKQKLASLNKQNLFSFIPRPLTDTS